MKFINKSCIVRVLVAVLILFIFWEIQSLIVTRVWKKRFDYIKQTYDVNNVLDISKDLCMKYANNGVLLYPFDDDFPLYFKTNTQYNLNLVLVGQKHQTVQYMWGGGAAKSGYWGIYVDFSTNKFSSESKLFFEEWTNSVYIMNV